MNKQELLACFHEAATSPRKLMDKYLAEGRKVVLTAPVYTPEANKIPQRSGTQQDTPEVEYLGQKTRYPRGRPNKIPKIPQRSPFISELQCYKIEIG